MHKHQLESIRSVKDTVDRFYYQISDKCLNEELLSLDGNITRLESFARCTQEGKFIADEFKDAINKYGEAMFNYHKAILYLRKIIETV